MSLRWDSVVVDCHDPRSLAHWWADVLDWQVVLDSEEELVIAPEHAAGAGPLSATQWRTLGPVMVFGVSSDDKQVKNRLHLDLAPHTSDDRDAEIARLVGRGASHVDIGQGDDLPWTVLADPEGNEFCVLSARDR
ncbi:MAG TPA: VOC family protein [Flexivirga sp.]|uniref:VOC family protein n=1 Tax=Flexivirga sp. TaxID=1962927 RepID=UPI002BED5EC0|nr:VOC family protein [Flexivirga sp.]HWC21200.1 VOC family protein [Flexivirga sp.]